jgi:hypothetical protein
MPQRFLKLPSAGASEIGQLTDVLRCNLQESCHASAGMVPGPGRPGQVPGRVGLAGPARPARAGWPGRVGARPGPATRPAKPAADAPCGRRAGGRGGSER